MSSVDFLELLQRQPFEPFRIKLLNGSKSEVRHPEMVLLKLSVVWLHFPAQEYPIPAAARQIVVVLQNIAEIEFIVPPPPPSAN
jgi:hypothetical protein